MKQNKIGFVIDNTSIFSPEDIISLYVGGIFKLQALTDDEKSFEDFTNVNDFYKYLIDNNQFGKSSTDSLGGIKVAIDDALKKYEQVIVLPTSSKISSTYANACICAKDYDESKVVVIDTKSVVGATKYMVEYANKLIEQNLDFNEICQKLVDISDKMQAFIVISNFDALVKNGRIGKAKSQIANFLNIKAIVGINSNGVEIVSKQRSHKKAIKYFLDEFKNNANLDYEVFLGHIWNSDVFDQYVDSFEKNDINIHKIDIPPIIGLHGGNGLIGITYVKK